MRTSTSSTFAVSPDGKWVVVASDPTDDMVGGVMLYPVGGGSPTLVCRSCAAGNNVVRHLERTGPQPSPLSWSPDGKFVYINFQGSIYAIPLRPGQMLPPLPASGLRTRAGCRGFAGSASDPGTRSVRRPHPSDLRLHQGCCAAQHLPGSRAVIVPSSFGVKRRSQHDSVAVRAKDTAREMHAWVSSEIIPHGSARSGR